MRYFVKILALLLLLALLAQQGVSLFWCGYYIANKDYIANELCENKEKVEMNCEGKCYLIKKITKAEENTNPTKAFFKTHSIIPLYYENVSSVLLRLPNYLISDTFLNEYQRYFSIGYSKIIIPPPKLV